MSLCPTASILIADANPATRGAWRTNLEMRGYEVVETGTGKSAMAVLRARVIDLAILELGLPDQDGLETIRLMRQEKIRSCILATSDARLSGYLRIARLLGACAAIAKPVEIDSLVDAVEDILAAKVCPEVPRLRQ